MKQTQQKSSSAMLALTSAALALPGMSGKTDAAAPVSEPVLSYHASHYREADIERKDHLGGSRERYEIDTH